MYLIGFDLDGVIINSKSSMEESWTDVRKKFSLDKKYLFSDYFKHVGKPFQVIMDLMGLENFMPYIMDYYYERTSKYSGLIKLHPDIERVIDFCNRNPSIKTALITSKCKYRTLEILKSYNLHFDIVVNPEDTLRGKPSPEPLIFTNKLLKISTNKSLYIGDMYTDYLSSKEAGWAYLHASWGYHESDNYLKEEFIVNKSTDIIQKIEKYFLV